jgi:ADP-heptose:LPS heptosyltransferase
VVGFPARHLRERWAHVFYTETVEPPTDVHVVDKNLALLAAVGLRDLPKRFPLQVPERAGGAGGAGQTSDSGLRTSDDAFAVINPGGGWPNKRWPPEWFGAIADRLRANHTLPSVVLWGPGEENLARTVVELSRGAARLAPATDIGEMIALARAASLLVSGDTGPLHIAAAVGTPIVGIYGPTSPARNGPWDPADVCVSRFDACHCHHRRRCRFLTAPQRGFHPNAAPPQRGCRSGDPAGWCLLDISVDEVMSAIDQRLAASGVRCRLRTADSGRPTPDTGRRTPDAFPDA